jgi:hypothetical protein
MSHPFKIGPILAGVLLSLLAALPGRADWRRDEHSIAWTDGSGSVWKFSFDPAAGKPFFHPVRPVGGPLSLTNFKPKDHPWHYGMWFSWKYINHVNYWEEDLKTGEAQGKTRWTTPAITTRSDGEAVIQLRLRYINPSGQVEMTEERKIAVSAPDARGGYTIDWNGRFIAGPNGALLDRTPMPNEPGGKVNGGYAGLAVRMPSVPVRMKVVTTHGAVAQFVEDRARPFSPAVGCNFEQNNQPVGGLAILSSPQNLAGEAPWYLIDADSSNAFPDGFRFACAAVLAPHVLQLPPGGHLALSYRMVVAAGSWTPASLQAAFEAWPRG